MEFTVSYTVKERGKNRPEYNVDNDINGNATLENLFAFTKGALIQISDEVLREEQADGFDKKPTLVVDNKLNRRKEDVNPLGKIQYIARSNVKEIVMACYDLIRRKSPVRKGNYLSNNLAFFNGTLIARSRSELERWLDNKKDFEPRDIVRFVNTSPYARKLERYGVAAGKMGSIVKNTKYRQAKKHEKRRNGASQILKPNGAYALAFRALQRSFKNNSFLKFELIQGQKLGLTRQDGLYKKGRIKGQPYFYPSILISLVEAGLNDVSPKGPIQ